MVDLSMLITTSLVHIFRCYINIESNSVSPSLGMPDPYLSLGTVADLTAPKGNAA
jgi:hypothetical protein